MKKIFSLLIMLMTVFSAYTQDTDTQVKKDNEFKTIFGGKKVGGYGSIGAGYSYVDQDAAVTFDARGGIILGHWFAMGIGGGSYVSPYEFNTAHSADVCISGGHGGIFAEIILFPKSKVHLSFPVLVGIGGAAVSTRLYSNSSSEVINSVEESEVYSIVEPSAELEFNFTRFMRMALFCSYRYTTDLDFDSTWEISPDALVSYSAGLRLKFGKF